MRLNQEDEEIAKIASIHARESLKLDRLSPIPDFESLLVEVGGYKYLADHFAEKFFGFSKYLGRFDYLIGFNLAFDFSTGFKRFTIAHELGHLSIPEHINLLHTNQEHFSENILNPKDRIELQANSFSAHFLTPEISILNIIEEKSVNYETARFISDHYNVTQLAALYRMIDLANTTCTFIEVENNKVIKNWRPSNFFKSFPHKSIKGNKSNYSLESLKGEDHIVKSSRLKKWFPYLTSDVKITETIIDLKYLDRIGVLITVI